MTSSSPFWRHSQGSKFQFLLNSLLDIRKKKKKTDNTPRFTLHPSVSLSSVAARLPFTYTGADFYALCSDAMLKAVTRQASAVDAKIRSINADPAIKHEISTAYYFDHYATPEDIAVMVTEEDFMAANDELIPSVSAGELAHYERVRATFEGARDAPEKQARPAPQAAQRIVSASSTLSRSKGKAIAKGKGKAIALTSDDEYDDTEADMGGEVNGRSKGKGKAVMGFQDGTASDDDELY